MDKNVEEPYFVINRKDNGMGIKSNTVSSSVLSTEEELKISKSMFEIIGITVEDTVEIVVEISDKLGALKAVAREQGTSEVSWDIWNEDTKELQIRLQNLNLNFNADCCAIFAHRIFLMAVYKYPKYSFDIACLLDGFFKNDANSELIRETVTMNILNESFKILNKTTIYDDYLKTPHNSRSWFKNLEMEFPLLQLICQDRKTLRKKIKARHMNTATFFAYLMPMLPKYVRDNCLTKLLVLLLGSLDVTKYLAIYQIFGVCGFLIEDNLFINDCLSRLSDFLDSLHPGHSKLFSLRELLKIMYLQLIQRPNAFFPDKLKILHQVYPDQMKARTLFTQHSKSTRAEHSVLVDRKLIAARAASLGFLDMEIAYRRKAEEIEDILKTSYNTTDSPQCSYSVLSSAEKGTIASHDAVISHAPKLYLQNQMPSNTCIEKNSIEKYSEAYWEVCLNYAKNKNTALLEMKYPSPNYEYQSTGTSGVSKFHENKVLEHSSPIDNDSEFAANRPVSEFHENEVSDHSSLEGDDFAFAATSEVSEFHENDMPEHSSREGDDSAFATTSVVSEFQENELLENFSADGNDSAFSDSYITEDNILVTPSEDDDSSDDDGAITPTEDGGSLSDDEDSATTTTEDVNLTDVSNDFTSSEEAYIYTHGDILINDVVTEGVSENLAFMFYSFTSNEESFDGDYAIEIDY